MRFRPFWMIIPGYLLILTSILFAQAIEERVAIDEQRILTLSQQVSPAFSTPNYSILQPVYFWEFSVNPNPEMIEPLLTQGTFAGDINGDGINDLVFSDNKLYGDVRTEDLSDYVNKTLVFYGGNTSKYEYDQIVYDALIPLGDLNGDTFADAVSRAGELFNGSPQGYLSSGHSLSQLRSELTSFDDLDSDGFEDAILHYGNDDQYRIIWGAPEPVDIDTIDYTLGAEHRLRFFMMEIDSVPGAELLLVRSTFNGPVFSHIDIFQFGNDRQPLLLQTLSLPNSPLADEVSLNYGEINNVGHVLAVTINPFFPAWWNPDTDFYYELSNTGTSLFSATAQVLANAYTIPVGDLTGDKIQDFFMEENEQTAIISFGNAPQYDLLIGPSLQFGITETLGKGYGDLNGDGVNDLVLEEIGADSVGRRFLFGDTTANLQSVSALYSKSDMFGRVGKSANVADFNNDSLDDLAIIRLDAPEVWLYWGGDVDKLEPDLKLTSTIELAANTRDVVAGDFNGDQYSDIAVLFDTDFLSNGDRISLIEIYWGGPIVDGNSDHTIRTDEWAIFSVGYELFSIANAGDINNDGYQDIVVNAILTDPGDVMLFFGGPSISSEPDIHWDYQPRVLNDGRNLAGIGDINNDGIDDLAVSRIFATNPGGVGRIAIHYGFDGANGDTLNHEPDLYLDPDSTLGNHYVFAIGIDAGDFNGDGYPDIASRPWRDNDGAAPKIQIYFGGPLFDNTVDHHLVLPANAFGNNPEYLGTLGELTFIPDINGDGKDEIMVATQSRRGRIYSDGTNAVLYWGGTENGGLPAAILEAPNQSTGLGTDLNLYAGYSAVGDFDNNGIIDVVLAQREDWNDILMPSRVYRYELDIESSISRNDNAIPRGFALHQNYPNPFNPSTNIKFDLPQAAKTELSVYNLIGQKVTTLVSEELSAGAYRYEWRGTDDSGRSVASGIYFYQLQAADFTYTRKMILLR